MGMSGNMRLLKMENFIDLVDAGKLLEMKTLECTELMYIKWRLFLLVSALPVPILSSGDFLSQGHINKV